MAGHEKNCFYFQKLKELVLSICQYKKKITTKINPSFVCLCVCVFLFVPIGCVNVFYMYCVFSEGEVCVYKLKCVRSTGVQFVCTSRECHYSEI